MNAKIQGLLDKKIAFVGSESEGKPYIKAVIITNREGNDTFYFDSNHDSLRAEHWKRNPNACLYFYGTPIYRGVMLSGTMEIIDDLEIKKQQWKRSKQSIYKAGVTDPDYCIMKFTATKGRYYSMYETEDFDISEL